VLALEWELRLQCIIQTTCQLITRRGKKSTAQIYALCVDVRCWAGHIPLLSLVGTELPVRRRFAGLRAYGGS